MGIKTDIEFADSTANIQMGCDGCELWNPKTGKGICYAEKLVNFHAASGSKGWPESFDKPKEFPHRLAPMLRWPDLTGTDREGRPWLNGYPRVIFLNDLGDTFTKSMEPDWLAKYLDKMASSRHVFLIITKNAQRMRDFFSRYKVPANFWLVVTVTSKATYGRVKDLSEIDHGGVKGISYEPALGPISLDRIPGIHSINWMMCGGASGPAHNVTPFEIEWARRVMAQAQFHGINFFMKQLGSAPVMRDLGPYVPGVNFTEYDRELMSEWPEGTHFGNHTRKAEFNGRMAILKDRKGGNPDEWPIDLRLRQMPLPEIYAAPSAGSLFSLTV